MKVNWCHPSLLSGCNDSQSFCHPHRLLLAKRAGESSLFPGFCESREARAWVLLSVPSTVLQTAKMSPLRLASGGQESSLGMAGHSTISGSSYVANPEGLV